MDFEEFSKKFDLIYKKKDDEDSSELVESKTNNLQISSNILKEDKEIADLIGKDSDCIRHYIPQNLPSYTINIYTQNGEEIKQTSMKILKECKLHNQVQAEDRNITSRMNGMEISSMIEQIQVKLKNKTAAGQNPEMEDSSIKADLTLEQKIITSSQKELWTEKYKPQKFIELLTDEKVNRNILTWLMSWQNEDQYEKPGARFAILGRRYLKSKSMLNQSSQNQDLESVLSFRSKRILIIGGGPGVGKTQLAHCIAKHCGYHIETFGPDDDATKIFTATQNKTLTGSNKCDNKQTCLIIDGLIPGEQESDNIFKLLETYSSAGKFSNQDKKEDDQADKSKPKSVKIERQLKSVNKHFEIKRPIICIVSSTE